MMNSPHMLMWTFWQQISWLTFCPIIYDTGMEPNMLVFMPLTILRYLPLGIPCIYIYMYIYYSIVYTSQGEGHWCSLWTAIYWTHPAVDVSNRSRVDLCWSIFDHIDMAPDMFISVPFTSCGIHCNEFYLWFYIFCLIYGYASFP